MNTQYTQCHVPRPQLLNFKYFQNSNFNCPDEIESQTLALNRFLALALVSTLYGLVGVIDNTEKLLVMLLNATTKCDANHGEFVKLLIARRSSAWLTLIVDCAVRIDSVESPHDSG